MNLNYNSFFMKRFLQCGEHDLPNTVCDLAKRVAVCSIIWLVLAGMIAMITLSYFIGLVAVMLVMFTDTTWTTLSDKYEAGVVMFFTINSAILLLAGWFGGVFARGYLSRKFNSNTARKPIPAIEFVKGIWERIHDKTCRVIEYKNHPEDIRKAAYEAEYARFQSEIAKLKARQEYSTIDYEITASQATDYSIE